MLQTCAQTKKSALPRKIRGGNKMVRYHHHHHWQWRIIVVIGALLLPACVSSWGLMLLTSNLSPPSSRCPPTRPPRDHHLDVGVRPGRRQIRRRGRNGVFVGLRISTNSNNKEKEKEPATAALTPAARTSSSILLPEQNPFATPATVSSSGVVLGEVHDRLEQYYPTAQWQQRNAVSRTDGYWPYVQQGRDPPAANTYGEFDFYSFAQLLEVAIQELSTSVEDEEDEEKAQAMNITFTDIGSGAGRLVLAAAALHPFWRRYRGVELLPGLHAMAQTVHAQWIESTRTTTTTTRWNEDDENDDDENDDDEHNQPPLGANTAGADVDRIEWTCGSFTDPYFYFGDSQIIFCFSTCMDQSTIDSLGQAIGRQCRPGTVVITTDYRLPTTGEILPVEGDLRVPYGTYEFECVKEMDVWCWLLGGPSKAYVHKVTRSLYVDGLFPLSPPVLSLSEKAWRVVRDLDEEGRSSRADAFIRNVDNNIIFHGLPLRFLTRPRK
jgi:hypothetical protein